MLYTAEDIRQLNTKIQYQAAFIDRLRDEGRPGHRRSAPDDGPPPDRLLSNGHVLLEGVPGLAKTLAIKSLSQAIMQSSAVFSSLRIFFPPTSSGP